MNESKADQEVEEAIRMIGAAPGVQPKLYFRTRNLPWYGKMFRGFSTVWKKCFHSVESDQPREHCADIMKRAFAAYGYADASPWNPTPRATLRKLRSGSMEEVS